MENYKKGDYALNKFSRGIVYRCADRIVEVTIEDYLMENPLKTEQDFLALKALSDEIYHQHDLADNRYHRHNRVFSSTEQADKSSVLTIDEQYIRKQDETYVKKAAERLLQSGKLTEIQRGRFVQYFFQGLSYRQIAHREGVHFTSIHESINAATIKLRKFFDKF